MSKIRNHLFAREEKTPIYESMESRKIVGYLPKGSWMGIVKKCDQWIQIITVKFDGWVMKKYVEEKPELNQEIKIDYKDDFIQYLIPWTELKAG